MSVPVKTSCLPRASHIISVTTAAVANNVCCVSKHPDTLLVMLMVVGKGKERCRLSLYTCSTLTTKCDAATKTLDDAAAASRRSPAQ